MIKYKFFKDLDGSFLFEKSNDYQLRMGDLVEIRYHYYIVCSVYILFDEGYCKVFLKRSTL